jgi:DNA repair exonuclease SbcCD nuclease subunit
MKIAHIGCVHFDDHRRPDDTRRVVEAFLAQARAAQVDLIVHGGDASCDQSRPASETEREAVRWFDAACADIAPTVRIRGNHDVETDEGLFSRQVTRHPFRLHTRPNFPGPVGDLMVKTTSGLAGIIALPWCSRAQMASRAPAGASIDDITRAINAAAGQLLEGARLAAAQIRAAGGVPILLHHGTVFEAASSSGWKPLGETVAFTIAQLREVTADYVALNHFHNRQEWDGGRISYSGSIEARNAGEPEAKGWNLVEIDGDRLTNTFVELPARRIELIEYDWSDGVEDAEPPVGMKPPDVAGALVRFRYRIRPEDMHLVDEDAIRRAILDAGAHEVRIEAVPEVVSRVRCEEIASASGLFDELIAWAGATGKVIDDEQRERLRLACSELEAPRGQEVTA